MKHEQIFVRGKLVCRQGCPRCWKDRVIGEARYRVVVRERSPKRERARYVGSVTWRNGFGRIVDELTIRAEYECGFSVQHLARKFGIGTRRVSRIVGVILRPKGVAERTGWMAKRAA